MAYYLLDTNILLRIADTASADHDLAIERVAELIAHGDQCVLTPQVLIEFWAVATRPTNVNGLGWSTAQTQVEIENWLNQFPLLSDNATIFSHWHAIVSSHNLKGKRVHDARLLAVMQAHAVDHLLTFNPTDFPTVPGITIVTL